MLKVLREPVRTTDMPSSRAVGAAPGQPDTSRVMSWPRSARRPKTSCRWISAPPACGFSRSCQLATRIFRLRLLYRLERSHEGIQHAVHEPRALVGAVLLGEENRFLDRHARRHIVDVEHLGRSQ